MGNLQGVRNEVERLHRESADECMRTWFFENHVALVARYSAEIAPKAGADAEIAVLASLLHDVARTKRVFAEPALSEESDRMAAEIMGRNGYSPEEAAQVRKAVENHGCKEKLPETEEGRVMATADALAHLMSDFYLAFGFNHHWADLPRDYRAYRKWVGEKIERDYRKKIFYPEYKELAAKRYEALKLLFTG